MSSLVFAAGLVGALGFLAVQLQHGRISSGTIITAIVLGGEISGQLGAAASRSAWLGWATSAVTRYLRIADRIRESSAALEAADAGPAPASLSAGIRLEMVTFRYPGAGRDVLHDLSVVLPAGAVLAVVGENGAGKTTLVKLLCRFDEPDRGSIPVDGQDMREIRLVDWRRRTTVAFQDYARFELRAREEVGTGDLPRIEDDDAILAALERAHARDLLKVLPKAWTSNSE